METFSRGWVSILVVVLGITFSGVVQTYPLDYSGISYLSFIHFEQNYVMLVCVQWGYFGVTIEIRTERF